MSNSESSSDDDDQFAEEEPPEKSAEDEKQKENNELEINEHVDEDESKRFDDGEIEGSSKNLCDFDLMLKRKREENRANRKRKSAKNIDLINDNDDAIAKLIADMRQASRDDKELNSQRKPATNKLKMLSEVIKKLKKVDLIMAFIEANVLSVMTDWLAPMPYDKSLPHVRIRTEFLKMLEELRIDEYSRLKESGIGKAVMYLYRHPKEERDNKKRAGRIVTKWARPIFNVTSDFSNLSKEDRKARDEEMARKLGGLGRKRSSAGVENSAQLRPGDAGWVPRARVPMPICREYVTRPEWTSEVDISECKKKRVSRLEKHKRNFADKRKLNKQQHAMKLSLEGKNMGL